MDKTNFAELKGEGKGRIRRRRKKGGRLELMPFPFHRSNREKSIECQTNGPSPVIPRLQKEYPTTYRRKTFLEKSIKGIWKKKTTASEQKS